MKDEDILKALARGEITKEELKRCPSIAVIGFDPEISAGFIGYLDGNIIKVTPDKYSILVGAAELLANRPVFNVGDGDNRTVIEAIRPVLSTVRRTTENDKKMKQDEN